MSLFWASEATNATKIIQASRWEQGEEYVAVTNRNASGNNSR